jgi:pyruvate dehydrogenase E1 component alpha subunit
MTRQNIKIKEKIIKFEDDIGELYKQAKIQAPIHLAGINETQLIKIFKKIKKTDWIFSTWRNHYHWLLSRRSPKKLKKQILDGHSMHVFGKRFFTSAIVGGISPIALGVAYALKKKRSKSHVWCFLGDMAYSGGLASECIRYAKGHDLPITYVIEDNGLSVRSKTKDTWGRGKKKNTCKYKYKRKYPHAGCGVFVLF